MEQVTVRVLVSIGEWHPGDVVTVPLTPRIEGHVANGRMEIVALEVPS